MSTHIEELRWKIDEAMDEWLIANGCTFEETREFDYSYIDNELNDLLTYIKGV